MTTMTSPPVPTAEPATVRVTVAVPTYRRPEILRALLPLLLDQVLDVTSTPGSRYRADVLVVDNDPERSAAAVVDGFRGVRYVAEPTPGIAAVRNRALHEGAGSGVLAFIDDDERPADGWLRQLLETWAATGAAAVAGRVLTEYDGELDPWIRAGDFFFRRTMPTGTEVDVAACGNLLLDLDQVRGYGVRFEPGLGLGGGEDNLFSRQLVRAGGRMLWCDESAVVDHVPAERMTRAWVRFRARSHGNVTVTVDLWLASGPGARLRVRAGAAVRGALCVGGGAARWGWGLLSRSLRHQGRGARYFFRGLGMIGGACGLVDEEYSRSGHRWRRTRGSAR
jgi:succinoglycan biosynthesis protein ExoM